MCRVKHLDELSSNQAANEAMAKEALGDLWPVASDVMKLFESLASMFEPSHPGHLGVLRSLLFAYRAGSMAMLDVVRFQFVEASSHERRMLEWCALAAHFTGRPDDFHLWQEVLSIGLDPRRHPRWKEYRTRFGPEAVRNSLGELSPLLSDAYQRCNLMVHGSVASQVRAFQVVDEGDAESVRLLVKFTDIEQGSALPLAGEVFQVLNSALESQRTLAGKLLGQSRRAAWDSTLSPVRLAIAAQANRWKRIRAAGRAP